MPQAPYNDRWERTKRYLLRNFLVDPGFQLSPIPEEQRSSPESESGSLPELTVEPAPDRHDHEPGFYEGLERRMRRYYRQLFLGENESDKDSTDFEVNQSMASTFMPNIDGRNENKAKNIKSNDLDISKTKDKELTIAVGEENADDVKDVSYGDKLIDTCATYNDTTHISIDDSNKSSSVENENEEIIQSIDSRSESNETSSGNEDYDNRESLTSLYLDDINRRLNTIEEISEPSVSENSIKQCRRISTTVAEIHEPPARGSVQFDNGSPVLIPRLLQFGRAVFGGGIRCSGQSINTLESSDETIQLPTRVAEDLNRQDVTIEEPKIMQKLLTSSELTRIHISEPLIDFITFEKQDIVDENHEVIEDKVKSSGRESNESLVNPSKAEADQQDKSTETQSTSSDNWLDDAIKKGVFVRKARQQQTWDSEEDSFDYLGPIAHSSERSINDEVEVMRNARRSEELRDARPSGEVMRDARRSGEDVSWHGQEEESPALAFEAKTSAAKAEDVSSSSTPINASLDLEPEMAEDTATNPHDYARIDFSSVCPIEDIDELSHKNKRRSDSREDEPEVKKKKDMAIQTRSDEVQWENVRKEFFVGPPLVFRLCGCREHVCS